jgi:hypothetical protein
MKTILGVEIVEAPRETFAGADCWLSPDGRWIVAARVEAGDRVLRWRAEA